MPIARYVAWVGTSLLALLFLADWWLPKPAPEPARDAIDKPIIRIASIQQPPERIVIDTSQPTIVPPPTLVGEAVADEPSPLQSYASVAPAPAAVDVDRKGRKISKRQRPKVAASGPRSAAAATASSATTFPPTKISLMDMIAGQLGRNLFNLR